MAARAQRRLDLETDLRLAVSTGQFVLHFQPIVSLSARTIVGGEALIRWQRDDGTLIAPGEFISLAEETGLIIPLGQWVLEEACRAINRFDQAIGCRHVPQHPYQHLRRPVSPARFRRAGDVDPERARRRSGENHPRSDRKHDDGRRRSSDPPTAVAARHRRSPGDRRFRRRVFKPWLAQPPAGAIAQNRPLVRGGNGNRPRHGGDHPLARRRWAAISV